MNVKMKTTRDLITDELTVQPLPITFDKLFSAVNAFGPITRNAVRKSLNRLVSSGRVSESELGIALTGGARAESSPVTQPDVTT